MTLLFSFLLSILCLTPLKATIHTPLSFFELKGKNIYLLTFDDRDFHLSIAHQPKGPASQWKNAKHSGKSHGAIAAINGGFFTPKGTPLGLLIAQKKRYGSINKSPLGSGCLFFNKKSSGIIRRQQLSSILKKKPDNLLQSGPLLIEGNQPVKGLSAKKLRARSFILWNGNHGWAIGYAKAASLQSLSNTLHLIKSPFRVHTALNLDGGSSSDFWIARLGNMPDQHLRPFFNKPAANYLLLLPRTHH